MFSAPPVLLDKLNIQRATVHGMAMASKTHQRERAGREHRYSNVIPRPANCDAAIMPIATPWRMTTVLKSRYTVVAIQHRSELNEKSLQVL
jgi:hypothetical protein